MSTFKEAIQERDFVLTAELKLARETGASDILEQAAILDRHTDAIQIPDNHNARVHMTPLAVASTLLKNEFEPLVQLTCRDRNRVALESEILSLGAMGVENLLLMRGDDLPGDHRPKVKQVFELGGKQLIETARALADDPTVKSAPDFCIGTVATVFNPKAAWTPRSLLTKVEAGARFIQTQLCFDVPTLRRYMNHLVEARLTWKASIIVSVATLPSAMTARWLRENLRGSVVPKKVIRRLQQARDPEKEGVLICTELLQEMAEVPGVSGAHLMTPGEVETVPAAILAAGLRNKTPETD
jgi:methylenetetrahydrofolate reductase (NADPH)